MIRGDRPVKNDEEIEITPEMIEAGLNVLNKFNRDLDSGSDFVREVYREMGALSVRASADL